jgi:hypothetical protein
MADPRLLRVGGDTAHVVPRPLGTQAPKRQDGMELDRVGGDAGLAVLEVKERDAGNGRPLAEPHRTPGLRHLPASQSSHACAGVLELRFAVGADREVERGAEEAALATGEPVGELVGVFGGGGDALFDSRSSSRPMPSLLRAPSSCLSGRCWTCSAAGRSASSWISARAGTRSRSSSTVPRTSRRSMRSPARLRRSAPARRRPGGAPSPFDQPIAGCAPPEGS